MPLSQIHEFFERNLLEETSAFTHLYKRAADLLELNPFFPESPSLLLEGTSWVLEAPEFQNIERTRRLVRSLEKKDELNEILRRDLSANDVKLHIGEENRGTSFTECTVVAAPYRLRGSMTGTIGVIGPTRMDYPRVTSLVKRMAHTMSRIFQE